MTVIQPLAPQHDGRMLRCPRCGGVVVRGPDGLSCMACGWDHWVGERRQAPPRISHQEKPKPKPENLEKHPLVRCGECGGTWVVDVVVVRRCPHCFAKEPKNGWEVV